MDYFIEAWAATSSIERGYSNRPPDPETMFGITVAVARAHGYGGPMRDLPYSIATSIAKQAFWDALRLDEVAQVSPRIALELFDSNINLWFGAAAKWFQTSLNALNVPRGKSDSAPADITIDGQIGSRTIVRFAAIFDDRPNGEIETIILRTLNSMQGADYARQAVADPNKRKFFAGWMLKRVEMDNVRVSQPEVPKNG